MQLISFSGLPGTGKSTLAETVGQILGIPVFAKDLLEATLWRNGVNRDLNSGWVAYELLDMLIESQLKLGQSVIVDSVAANETLRLGWHNLAGRYGAAFRAIECICSNETLHRTRLQGRQRNIPGWYELDWDEVESVRARYEAWSLPHLIIDTVNPQEENVQLVMDYLKS